MSINTSVGFPAIVKRVQNEKRASRSTDFIATRPSAAMLACKLTPCQGGRAQENRRESGSPSTFD